MLTLYFSGTGNTRYIAKNFSKLMECQHHSIEEMVKRILYFVPSIFQRLENK